MSNAVSIRIRDATPTDEPFMWRMLGYAASDGDDERTADELRAEPALGCYLDGWGRTGDVGVVAVDDDDDTGDDDTRIGAATQRRTVLLKPMWPPAVAPFLRPSLRSVTSRYRFLLAPVTLPGDRRGGAGSVTSRYRFLLAPVTLPGDPSRRAAISAFRSKQR